MVYRVEKPYSAADALIGSIAVAGQSVVTSGIYERYFEQDGKRWHHILDPRSATRWITSWKA